MKIIALLPVKNESWVLPTYLSSIRGVADEIIALDDSSTDESRAILEAAGARVIPFSETGEVNMSQRRMKLLEEGRRAKGTHFIWLDADEAFSFPFNQVGRERPINFGVLKPGEKLSFRWITLWKDLSQYRNDSSWKEIYKDFVVCDDPSKNFEDQFLSEARTAGTNDRVKKVSEKDGVVLHFQFVAYERALLKQAYYRIRELIEGKRSARRINVTYSITLDSTEIKTKVVSKEWFNNLELPNLDKADGNFYLKKIFEWFDQYGITFFEPLQIWQIPILEKEFQKRESREPKVATFPSWLIKLNNWRHKFI